MPLPRLVSSLCLVLLIGMATPIRGADATPERVIAKMATQANPGQQYSVYLPAGYPGKRRWPLLIVLDPRGRAEATRAMAQPGAAAHGWVVVSSYQSRSDDLESITLNALQALLDEIGERYAYDPKRLYLAGMSGTAKTLWTVQEPLHGVIAGFIGAGGGRPPEFGRLQSRPPAFYGIAGDQDFNYQQMRDLDGVLAKAGSAHRLAIFDGEHGWPPRASDFTAAIDWLELTAMREGLAPRDDAWIDAQLVIARTQVAKAADSLARWRALDQLVRDFDGLRDVAVEKADADRTRALPETKRLLAREDDLRSDERRQAQRLDAWLERFNARAVDGRVQPLPSLTASMADLRLRPIQAQAAESDAMLALSAKRKLALMYASSVGYLPRATMKSGDLARAQSALELATAIYPDRPTAYCRLAQVEATLGRTGPAFERLQQCLDRGYADREALATDSAWEPMRADPRWTTMLSGIKSTD